MAPPRKHSEIAKVKLLCSFNEGRKRLIRTQFSTNHSDNLIRRSKRGIAAPEYNENDLFQVSIDHNRPKAAPSARSSPDFGPEFDLSRSYQFSDSYSLDESAYDEPAVLQDIDPPEAYPWNDEALALIRAIVADPNLADALLMASANRKNSLRTDRNVSLKPSDGQDPYTKELNNLRYKLNKVDHDTWYQDLENQLWEKDKEKCSESNEALFQRTIMIAMIDRYRLFYHHSTSSRPKFTFSTEELWICPPMPSRGPARGSRPSPRPKPDLCVSFLTEELIPEIWEMAMPSATMDLVRFEGPTSSKIDRAFAFLTIEAKAAYSSPEDERAKLQGLNCASLALHNMYEFFKEAKEEKKFFANVRFFSVVATAKGIIIRIHRAIEIGNERKAAWIENDYPLEFEFNEFWSAYGKDINRKNVISTFERIIQGYGSALFEQLNAAAKKIYETFESNPGLKAERSESYYRHGQTWKYQADSRATSQAADSVRSELS